jgi:hypothetical protein
MQIMAKRKKGERQIMIRIPESLYEQIKSLAEPGREKVAQCLRWLIFDYFRLKAEREREDNR